MNILLVDSKDPIKIQANDNKCFTFLKAFFGLNLCCTIIKFNFHFGNKLVSLEIRQVKERRRGGGGGEATNTEKSLLSPRHGGEQNTTAAHFDKMTRRGQLQYSALMDLL